MEKTLIERAIESAKARIYKISVDEKRNPSSGHLRKIERQKEVAEVTVMALERMLPKKRGKYGCPNCNTLVDMQNYCHECGQRLDWSE